MAREATNPNQECRENDTAWQFPKILVNALVTWPVLVMVIV